MANVGKSSSVLVEPASQPAGFAAKQSIFEQIAELRMSVEALENKLSPISAPSDCTGIPISGHYAKSEYFSDLFAASDQISDIKERVRHIYDCVEL